MTEIDPIGEAFEAVYGADSLRFARNRELRWREKFNDFSDGYRAGLARAANIARSCTVGDVELMDSITSEVGAPTRAALAGMKMRGQAIGNLIDAEALSSAPRAEEGNL